MKYIKNLWKFNLFETSGISDDVIEISEYILNKLNFLC